MKRHLNTSYRLVWNHITGTLVVASELARSRGKRAGVAVALSLAAVTSVPALAADKVVQAGETVNDGTLTNHDNQIVFGTANGMTISTGLEYGPDNEANTGGQWIQNGGTAKQHYCHRWWSSESECRRKRFRHGYQCRRRTEPSGAGSEHHSERR
ncbi:antigen 43, truncation [Escherichia coli]|uniref:Antigen 43, truncation n=1 Tax=Escherichia coli TaxID=562 RepID=A0A376LH13_ECOLX|nr:antigen 43, truncation [Escherichia coli]